MKSPAAGLGWTLLLLGCRDIPRSGPVCVEIDLPRQSAQLEARNQPELLFRSPHQQIRLISIDQPVPLHRHEFSEETFYVLAGTGDLELGDHRRPLRAGDLVVVPANTPHGLTPRGAEPIRVLSLYTPELIAGDRVLEASR